MQRTAYKSVAQARRRPTKDPGGGVSPLVPGGAEGGRSQSGRVWTTCSGGVTGSVAGGRAREILRPGGAEWQKAQGGSTPQRGGGGEGFEGLMGDSRDWAEELAEVELAERAWEVS